MTASYFEIIELSDGKFALRRKGSDSDFFMTIAFSDKARVYLEEHCIDVAKIMINSGVQAMTELFTQENTHQESVEQEPERILH